MASACPNEDPQNTQSFAKINRKKKNGNKNSTVITATHYVQRMTQYSIFNS